MKIRKVEAKIQQVAERTEHLSEKSLPCLCAFVTLESQRGRAYLLKKYYRNGFIRLFQSQALRFRCAARHRYAPLALHLPVAPSPLKPKLARLSLPRPTASPNLRRRGQHALYAEPAKEPTNIVWENLQFGSISRFFRRFFARACAAERCGVRACQSENQCPIFACLPSFFLCSGGDFPAAADHNRLCRRR